MSGRKRALSKKELVNFTSQLAIMTRSGVDVATALESLARQARNPRTHELLQDVHRRVMEGRSFSEALNMHRDALGSSYVASVAAGEASGQMSVVLGHIAELQRSEMRVRNALRTLMAYPIVLTTVSSLVVVALMLFVLPQFAQIFEDYNLALPALTQMLIAVAAELRYRFWLWGPLVFGLLGSVFLVRFSKWGRDLTDSWVLNLYLIRDVTRALMVGRLCRLLGLMIESGVPLLDCIRLARDSVNNSHYRRLLSDMENDVLNGRGLGGALLNSEFVPPSAAEMVATAERTANLGPVTKLIGEHYEEEGQTRLREIVTLLEPAITVVMGVIVAAVVLAVMLPMFDLASLANHR